MNNKYELKIGEKIFKTEINNIKIETFDVSENPFYDGIKVVNFLYNPNGVFKDFVDNELVTVFSDNLLEVRIPEDDSSDYYNYPYELCLELLDILGLNNINDNSKEYYDWFEIVLVLLDDEMIKCQGCDGLHDAYNVLNGLLGMSELMSDYMTNDFILEALNRSIKARNHYCNLGGSEELPYVELTDNGFKWK